MALKIYQIRYTIDSDVTKEILSTACKKREAIEIAKRYPTDLMPCVWDRVSRKIVYKTEK